MTAAESRTRDAASQALLECDIVMAGGVTSGLIYPGAVAMIARRYRFRSIGGTSVGAIAAAVTAAAEYGRQTGRNPTAFEDLSRIPRSLGAVASDGHSRLFHLFTPEASTKPLMRLVAPLLGQTRRQAQIAKIFMSSLSFWQVFLPVVLTVLAASHVMVTLVREQDLARAVVAFVTGFALFAIVWIGSMARMLAYQWLPAWRNNGYGICTGLAAPALDPLDNQAGFDGLTNWLHATVQTAAGRAATDAPLTFGDLWTAGPPSATGAPEADPKAPRAIDLFMIASDISRNRTVQLPFMETPSPLYIETSVLERYFPNVILDWMRSKAGLYDSSVEQRTDVTRLPLPQDLPIVFGARLSLSFPVLLSAVPLLTPDLAKGVNGTGKIPLRRVWYSDGGLTSNFPVHFFDSPIPSRPTFCLNLVDFDEEAPNLSIADVGVDDESAASNAEKPIARPRSPSRTAQQRPAEAPARDPEPNEPVWGFVSMVEGHRSAPAPFSAFDTAPGTGLLSFASTLISTARYWSDNQILIAPGVRDRVVNIALRDDEGGLNLDMSPSVISDLDWRGRAAGLLIAARFDPTATVDPETGGPNVNAFASHRWVRYRNFMASFEDLSRRFANARRASDAAAAARQETPLDGMISGSAKEKLSYPAPDVARGYYRKVTEDLEQLAMTMAMETRSNENATFDCSDTSGGGAAPRPPMRHRLRPLADNDPRAELADLPVPKDHIG